MADQSVQTPLLNKPGTPSDIRMQVDFELPDDENYAWDNLEDYAMNQFDLDSRKIRDMADITKINAVLYFFEKKVIKEGKRHKDIDDLADYANLEAVYKKAVAGELNWAAEEATPTQSIIGLSKLGIAKLSHPCDREYVRTNLIQTMYPVDLIWKLLQVINRDFGKPHYDKALRIQNSLSEIFLLHHLRSDTRFHNKIATENINLTDPLMRIKIREMNRNDPLIKKKYLSDSFDLKKFILTIFELYFPNVTWRYIGGDQEMHRWALEILLYSFELGIWESKDLSNLLNSLYMRIENLVVLENRSYMDFTTTLTGYPKFVSNMKKYFKICNNLVISTCLHIVILMNDESFKQRFPLYNSSVDYSDLHSDNLNWKSAYFNNYDISDILHKILTKYLLIQDHTTKKDDDSENAKAERQIEAKKFKYVSDFLLFITDQENDLFYTSANNAKPDMVAFYTSSLVEEEKLAVVFREKLIQHLDSLAACFKKDAVHKLEDALMTDLMELLKTFSQRQGNEQSLKKLKFTYAMRGIPKILMSMMSIAIELEISKKAEMLIKVALVDVLKHNQIGQALMFDDVGMFHFNEGFRNKRNLESILFLDEVFSGNFHIFYNHRYLCEQFLDIYESVRKKNTLLEKVFTPEGRRQLHKSGDATVSISNKWIEEVLSNNKIITGVTPQEDDGDSAKQDAAQNLTSLFIYYAYTKWLSNLFETLDPNFLSKFFDLRIQDSIATPFFEVFMPILLNKDFLPKTADGSTYVYQSMLQPGDTFTVSTLSDRVKNGELTEADIRGIIFEIAMMTADLVNKVCKRYYTQSIYEFRFMKHARKLLPDTEYLLQINGGLSYRKVILEMYSIFVIFPNNHLLSGRKEHFPHEDKKSETLIPTKDKYTVTVHSEIMLELGFIPKIEANKVLSPSTFTTDVQHYFYYGLLPLLLKYKSGMYHLYTVNPELKAELDRMKEIANTLKTHQAVFQSYGVQFNLDNIVHSAGSGDGMMDGFASLLNANQVAPASSTPAKPNATEGRHRKRPKSFIEKSSPMLVQFRDLMEDVLAAIKAAYFASPDQKVADFFRILDVHCYRGDVLSDPVKFDKVNQSEIETDPQSGKSALSAFTETIDFLGLQSPEHGYYRWLINDYRLKKKEAIQKQGDQNIFVNFLDTNEGSAKSVIGFFVQLHSMWWHNHKKIENQDEDTDGTEGKIPDKIQLSDNLSLMAMDQHQVLRFVEFLDRVMNNSKSIKMALYMTLTEGEDVADAKSFLSLLYCIMMRFFSIAAFKPFMDGEWRMMNYWSQVFLSFFKNLCENNFHQFKTLLGELKPNVPEAQISFTRSLFFEVFVYIESTLANTKVINTYHRLVAEERAELYPLYITILSFLSECCCGPCKPNQDAIFRFRTDMFANIIRRVIDDIESSHYQIKDSTLDYIHALTESNDAIIKYFGNNFTFEELLTTVHRLLKRLYIYSIYSHDKRKFAKLIRRAKEKYEKEKNAEIAKNMALRFLPESSEKFYDISAMKPTVDNDMEFDPERPELICQAVADYITIIDYKQIFKTYIQSETFSGHHIMSAVLKITDLILKCATLNDSFKIYLDNTYRRLIDCYGEEVPVRIRNNFPKYERQPIDDDVLPEKYHFFMFMTKITSTLDVINDTGKKVLVTYPMKPCVFFLTQATKDEYMQVVDLEQPTYDLVRDFHRFQIEMEDNIELHRNYPSFYKLSSDDSFMNIKKSVWTIGLVLNILLLIFYRRTSEEVTTDSTGNNAIIVVGAVNAAISFLFFVVWFLSKYRQKSLIAKQQFELQDPLSTRLERLRNWIEIYFYYSMFQQNYPVFFLWHVLTNVLGIFLSPFFYTLQLLSIIFISKTTRYVVQSITTHFDQLSLTFMLSIFVMYSYSMLSAEQFFTTLAGVDQTTGQLTYCTTLWDCLLYHIDFGLRNGGGIADSSSEFTPFEPSSQRFVAKFFYNVIFFMLINVISLNIIFGIIIDTFATMRDENTTRCKLLSDPSEHPRDEVSGVSEEQGRDPDRGTWQVVRGPHHIRSRLLELLQLPHLPEPEGQGRHEWARGIHQRPDRRYHQHVGAHLQQRARGRSLPQTDRGD